MGMPTGARIAVNRKNFGVERFGPTLAAEHLAEDDGIVIDHKTLPRYWFITSLTSAADGRMLVCAPQVVIGHSDSELLLIARPSSPSFL
jgi:hypothetical protein